LIRESHGKSEHQRSQAAEDYGLPENIPAVYHAPCGKTVNQNVLEIPATDRKPEYRE
jgi:hypothetical protein